MYDTLKAIYDSLPPRKDQVFFVHIDDLLFILRGARRLGRHAERATRSDGLKLSIWLVYPDDKIISAPIEFYVDVTRTMERGKIIGVDRAAMKPPKPKVEWLMRWHSLGYLSDFDRGKSDYTFPTIT